MNDFASRLKAAQNTAEDNKKKNQTEAQNMVLSVIEELVAQIEAEAKAGSTRPSANCEVNGMQLFTFKNLMEFDSTEDAVKAFCEMLRDLLENTGSYTVSRTHGGGIYIELLP